MNRILQLICVMLVFTSGTLFAQPVNDNCGGALPVELAADEASAVQVDGDTRGATGDLSVPSVCSGSWFMDDVWYSITIPVDVPEGGIIIKTYFGDESTDVPAVGMAFYPSCDSSATAWACFSSADPVDDQLELGSFCLIPGETYYVRVWSGVSPNDNEGTFRIAAFGAEPPAPEVVLWEEQFEDGLDGWTTFGTCFDPDSNANATWKYLPEGLLDKGNFINDGFRIASPTWCNGAVGVDSDFDDNNGTGDFGAGPCPAPGQYFLESPVLYTTGWGVPGISITWVQATRQFQSTYFISFRTNETGGTWTDWRDFEINTEFVTNAGAETNDVVRMFLGGATEGDSLQFRYVYNANYYMWGIDDIKLIATEANNMRSMSNFYAIAPALNVPVGQEVPFYGLNDVYNAGAKDQTNVNLNLQVIGPDGGDVFNEDLSYGTMGPDSLAENVNFANPVDYSGNEPGEYTGTYTVTADSAMIDTDFDWSDNQNSFAFRTNGAGWYELEDGFTTAFRVSTASYDDGAPLSMTWGNYMKFPNGSDCTVEAINWGISNPDAIPGIPINIILFKWVDLDENQTVQFNERQIIGFATVTVNGDEGPDARWDTELENFVSAGDPIVLEDGGEYLVMVEYNAVDQASVIFHATEAIDYRAVAFSSDQAGAPSYMSVMGHSPDGNVQGIDYQVRELGTGAVFFGNAVIPVVRMKVLNKISDTKDLLNDENLVEVYPNPANQQLTVSVDFTEVYDEVRLEIYDVTGKLIESRQLDGVQTETIELNVSQYVNGAYILKVQTEDGSRTTKFVVQH